MQEIEPNVISSSLKRVELPEPIMVDGTRQPAENGDVVAVEVTAAGGSYDTVEQRGGEDKTVEVGDVMLGIISYRRAVEGFVGVIPDEVGEGDQLHFIGGGGVIGKCISYPEDVGQPFEVKFLGFVKQRDKQREKLNIRDYAVDWAEHLQVVPPLIVIAGTRMDSGKTTLAANLIKELSARGYRLGAAKLTGFTRQRDRIKMQKYGASKSLDFTDAGLTSTLFNTDEIRQATRGVLNHFDTEEIDAVVVEMGGGVIGPDHVLEVTTDPEIRKHTKALICTAMDPVAAYGLVKIFEEHDMRPNLLSGPSTDTKTGKDQVEDHTGVKALNGRKDVTQIADLIEEKIS